jgi:endonuclease/exonuclease/phosphatase family metal-dependent hydrolase
MLFRNHYIAWIACLFLPWSFADAEEFRIGAWNIEWLGFPNMRGKPGKDVTQAPSDLANYIADAHLDVLALEEIGVDQDHAPWRSSPLDETLAELKKNHGQPWQYLLFPKADYPKGTEDFITRGQHIGIAWRSDRAKLVGEPFAVPVGKNETYGNKFWERRANAVKLSFGEGKTDLVFVPVHLKSNRNDANGDESFTQKQRVAEAKVFVANLKLLKDKFKDEDIVLLGDTNFLADDDEGPRILTDAGFVDLNESDRGTTAAWGSGYSSAPFDRIFVPTNQPEFKSSAQKIHATKHGTDDEIKDFKKRHSDHYLVSCVIEVGNDDD